MPDPVVPAATPANGEPAAPPAAPAPEVTPAATPESAPAAEPQATPKEGQDADSNAPPANTGEPGAAPAEEPRVKLSELIAERKKKQAAENRAAYLEGRLEGSQPPPAPGAQPGQTALPSFTPLEEFKGTYDEWIVAKTKFEINQDQEQRNRTTQIGAVERTFQDRRTAANLEIPDLIETLDAAQTNFQPAVVTAIKKSDIGPQMAYYLAKNPEEAARIAQMEPELALMELGSLKEKVKESLKPKPKASPRLPPPIVPGNGSGAPPDVDMADLSVEEYARKRQEQMFVRVNGRLVRR
jgi:hypothetical protein